MALASGSRLGPCEIVAALGAGGIGEVYRARDSRRGRDVAIRLLPEGIARDPERLERFEHEARVLEGESAAMGPGAPCQSPTHLVTDWLMELGRRMPGGGA